MNNKKPTGFWTYKRCLAEAQKYKYKMDFRKGAVSAYSAAKDHGWLADYTWLKSRSLVKWTYKTCYEEAKKYKTRSAFGKMAGAAYQVALHNNWLDDYIWFVSNKKPAGYWTYERCYEEALKFKKKTDFLNAKGLSRAYKVARANGWLKDYTWFKDYSKPHGYWTYDACKAEAAKYEKRNQFKEAQPGAYTKSRINGWLDDFFPKNE